MRNVCRVPFSNCPASRERGASNLSADLTRTLQRLRSAITRMHVRVGHRQLSATSMSFGIATYTAEAPADGPTLLQMADEALYRAKREGRNRAVIAERLAA